MLRQHCGLYLSRATSVTREGNTVNESAVYEVRNNPADHAYLNNQMACPLVIVEPAGRSPLYHVAKRAIDIVGAAFFLLLLLPLFVVISAVIVLDSKGPILFFQQRTGKDGNPFRFYKFRTMVPGADNLKFHYQNHNEAGETIFKMKRDPRVTRSGRIMRKFSIDELPQLWNVLVGDMSFVGPRPMVLSETSKMTPEQHSRHSVQPGLLCLREVSGRSNLTFEKWMELDLEYIRKRSFWMDVSIVLKAVPAVLTGHGAY